MVITENEKRKHWVPHSFSGGGEDQRVKLCFETTEATNYLLEAHDRKEVEISSKHLLKTYSVPATLIWCFISHS